VIRAYERGTQAQVIARRTSGLLVTLQKNLGSSEATSTSTICLRMRSDQPV
jgi:hypothetical protein